MRTLYDPESTHIPCKRHDPEAYPDKIRMRCTKEELHLVKTASRQAGLHIEDYVAGVVLEAARVGAVPPSAREALRLCLEEIEQFHSAAHPGCTGGCPGHEAMDAARAVLVGAAVKATGAPPNLHTCLRSGTDWARRCALGESHPGPCRTADGVAIP